MGIVELCGCGGFYDVYVSDVLWIFMLFWC